MAKNVKKEILGVPRRKKKRHRVCHVVSYEALFVRSFRILRIYRIAENHQTVGKVHIFDRNAQSFQMKVCLLYTSSNHLVINKFVLFSQHHVAVQRQETSKLRRIKDINALKFTFPAVKLPVDPDGKLHIRCMRF